MALASEQRTESNWMSISEVLEATGLSAGTLYRKIREGKLPAFELMGKTVVSSRDLATFMKPVPLGPARKRGRH